MVPAVRAIGWPLLGSGPQRGLRLGAGLLLSLALHGPWLWWALQPAARPPPLPDARRLRITWVDADPHSAAIGSIGTTQPAGPTAAPAAPTAAARPAPVARGAAGASQRRAPTAVAASAAAAASAPIAAPPLPGWPTGAAAPAASAHDGALSTTGDGAVRARAMGRLLDSAAGQQALQSAAVQPLVPPGTAGEDGLARSIREAAHGDCMRGQFRGAGAGLLSLPMLAAAALRGECSR